METTNPEEFVPKISAFISISSCLILSIAYVGSLYVWNGQQGRYSTIEFFFHYCSCFLFNLMCRFVA